MRIAALYDIHANLPALDAVLVDVRAANVDLIVFGGDVIPGPMTRETLARVFHALDRAADSTGFRGRAGELAQGDSSV